MGCTGGERSAALSKAERWGAEWSAPGPAQAVCAACRETRSVFADAQFSEAVLWRGRAGGFRGTPSHPSPSLPIWRSQSLPWLPGRGDGEGVSLCPWMAPLLCRGSSRPAACLWGNTEDWSSDPRGFPLPSCIWRALWLLLTEGDPNPTRGWRMDLAGHRGAVGRRTDPPRD